MRFRRTVVVTLAHGDRSAAALLAERLLALLAAHGDHRVVLVIGRAGDWSPRLSGWSACLAADDLDDWWGGRLAERIGVRRDHRQVRALRLRYWRLRLRRARLVALSGPLPPVVLPALPAPLRAGTEQVATPEVSLPPRPPAGGPSVVALGECDGDAGIDLWMRAAHEAQRRGVGGRWRWFRTAEHLERLDGVRHDCWHLGLDVELVEVKGERGWREVADAIADCSVLVLTSRPGVDPLAPVDERLPWGDWAIRSGQVPIVGFAGTVPPVDELPGAVEVAYPDVEALADAVVAATRRFDAIETRRAVDGLVGAGRP